MKKNQYTLILGAILLSVVSFFAGTRYQLSKSSPVNQATNGVGLQAGTQNSGKTVAGQQAIMGKAGTGTVQNGQQGGMTSGEITSKDDESLTIKTSDGSSKIIIVAESTNYQETVKAALSDLAVGDSVTVLGSSNSDGSITAQTVTIGESAIPTGLGRPDDVQ